MSYECLKVLPVFLYNYEFKNNVEFLNFRNGNFKRVNAYFNEEGKQTVELDTLLILALNVVHTVFYDLLFPF